MNIILPFQQISITGYVDQNTLMKLEIVTECFVVFYGGKVYHYTPNEKDGRFSRLLVEKISKLETPPGNHHINDKGIICGMEITTKKENQDSTIKITYGNESLSPPKEICRIFKIALDWTVKYTSKMSPCALEI